MKNLNHNDKKISILNPGFHCKTNGLMVLSFLSMAIILGPSNLVNMVSAQGNSGLQNENISSDDLPKIQQSTDNLTQQQNTLVKPDAQIIVLAEDLFEIRDNLGEAREALTRGNLFELAEHINNLDNLITVMINPLAENTTAFEQKGQMLQQQTTIPTSNSNENGQSFSNVIMNTINPNTGNTNQTSSEPSNN